jgi:hypothetical protein
MTDRSEFASFEWSVIRLASYLPPGPDREPQLLFGTVSLLTKERARPRSSEKVEPFDIARGKGGKLFFRRTVLAVEEGIAWYRSSPLEGLATPLPTDEAERLDGKDGTMLEATSFIDDPLWPMLGIPIAPDLLSEGGGAGYPAPFVGSAASPARIHRRFGELRNFDAVITDVKAVAFLKKRVHVDLADYREYLGSLALIVPNPIVQKVNHYWAPSSDGVGEKLVYHVVPRPGETLDGLRLTMIDKKVNLLSRFSPVDVPPNGLIVVDDPQYVEQTGYALSHTDRGPLVYQQPLSFMRAAGFNLQIPGRQVRVSARKTNSLSSPDASYTVNELAQDARTVVGQSLPESHRKRIIEAEERRQRRSQARRYDQVWFDDGTRTEAIAYLQSRIGQVREYIWVADPYLGGNDQMLYLHATHRTNVTITILTSCRAFEVPEQADGNEGQALAEFLNESNDKLRAWAAEEARMNEFAGALATFKRRGIGDVYARVLKGRAPPLHDRFLVVDGTVWFLGNSLNALGSKASMILMVPDPEPVLDRLRALIGQATPFDKYRDERARAKQRAQKKRARP